MTLNFKERLRILFLNDYFLAFLFLLIYLCTNSYTYGWDDQHLEIPLLKHLIDPSLYKGDYYVESLSKNFSSYLYPVLAKFITVSQIPTVYWFLFLLARYIMFLFFYKLCLLISKDKLAALCAVGMFFLTGRTEEFLYRTFSHQELAEGLMFAGLYFFYKERYWLAAFIFGFAANIHAIYNLFPMCFMLAFLLFFHPQRWTATIKAGLIFILASMPFLLWQIPRSIHEKLSGQAVVPVSEWMPLYFRSCPQNFLFFDAPLDQVIQKGGFLLSQLEPYLFVLFLYIFLFFVHKPLRQDKKTHTVIAIAFCFIVFSNIFTYLIPSRFVLDLNLLRNEQYIRLLLMAYAAFWAVKVVKEGSPFQALTAAVTFLFIGFGNWAFFVIKFKKNIFVFIAMIVTFILLNIKRWPRWEAYLKIMLITLPLLGGFIGFSKFHYDFIQAKNKGQGFWQLQRNWVDLQLWVKSNTPKDALILAPINMDMGGFRIHSERKIVVCIRDCGIIGFDYKAAQEWKQRMEDMKGFEVMTDQIEPVNQAMLKAIYKYRVDYIVFMKYYEPTENNPVFKKVYQNEVFSIFKVIIKV